MLTISQIESLKYFQMSLNWENIPYKATQMTAASTAWILHMYMYMYYDMEKMYIKSVSVCRTISTVKNYGTCVVRLLYTLSQSHNSTMFISLIGTNLHLVARQWHINSYIYIHNKCDRIGENGEFRAVTELHISSGLYSLLVIL